MWNFSLDDECKASALTNEIILTTNKLKINGTPVNSIKKDGIFVNIIDKHLQMLKLMAKKNKFFNVQLIHLANNEFVNICHIIQNPSNGFLFEVFKKLGFPFPSIEIGYSRIKDTYKVYLTKKLIRMLDKMLVDSKKIQIILYLISIAEFLTDFTLENVYDDINFEYSDFDNTINITTSKNIDSVFKDFVLSFDGVNQIIVNDINDIENITDIQFYKTAFTGISSKMDMPLAGCYATCIDDVGKSYLIFKHGIPENEGAYIMTDDENKLFETNMTMLIDDTNESSFLSKIADNNKNAICIFRNVNTEGYVSKFLVKHKFEIVESEIDAFKNMTDFFTNKGIVERIPLKTLRTIFGDCFTSSIVEIDKDVFVKQYETDAFAKELLANRFDYYDTFKLPFSNDVLKGIISGNIYSMLFSGASGTGKTTAAKVICDRIGLPLVTINLSLNCEESDIFGCMVPNPCKAKPEDPEFVWQDGPATKAIRYGYGLTFEEINGGRPGVLMKLNSLLDETRQIELSSGEIVKAHKNTRIFGTCNIGYEGTNRFNKALVNRFEIVKIFEEPEKEECFDIIKNRLGYTNISNMETIWSVYKATKKYCEDQNLDVIISIRQLLNIFKLGHYYKNAKEAYIDIILNNAFLEEEEHLKYFIDTVLDAYTLSFKL